MDAQLRRQLRQTISIALPSGTTTRYGEVNLGAITTMPARVEELDQELIDEDGEVRRTSHRIITEGALRLDARVWLPGVASSDATAARRPMRVLTAIDERGAVDHYVTLV
jgi:hypothetical protein